MTAPAGGCVFAGTLAEVTFPMYAQAVARGAAVLVPVGVIEQHGPHLPLGTDVYAASQLARLVQAGLGAAGAEILVCPPVYWGVNEVTSAFPGSFRVRPDVFGALVHDVLRSLLDDGAAELYVINHHGDRRHSQVLRDVLLELHAAGATGVRWVEEPGHIARVGGDPGEPIWVAFEAPPEAAAGLSPVLGVHAHDLETALIDRYHPELVDRAALAALEPTQLTREDLERWRRGGEEARRVTPDGIFGDPHPRDASAANWAPLRAAAMAAAILDARRAA